MCSFYIKFVSKDEKKVIVWLKLGCEIHVWLKLDCEVIVILKFMCGGIEAMIADLLAVLNTMISRNTVVNIVDNGWMHFWI